MINDTIINIHHNNSSGKNLQSQINTIHELMVDIETEKGQIIYIIIHGLKL